MTINVRTCGIDESCQKWLELNTESCRRSASVSWGATVMNRECFLEEYDSDVRQQQQKWSNSSLMKWPQKSNLHLL